MSAFDTFYLWMVIVGMTLFVVMLAWATLYSGGSKPPKESASDTKATAAKRPDDPGRMAA